MKKIQMHEDEFYELMELIVQHRLQLITSDLGEIHRYRVKNVQLTMFLTEIDDENEEMKLKLIGSD